MSAQATRIQPKPWAERPRGPTPWLGFFRQFEWAMSWVAWALGNWAFLEVLNHLSAFSVLVVVILYFYESGDRLKQKHYQAWQVINTAHGKGGSGGRIEALQELNADHVSLIGVDASEAFLQGVSLKGASLSRCDLHASDLRDSDFRRATLSFCTMNGANFRNAKLSDTRIENAQLQGADLNGSNLRGAKLSGADLDEVDLRNADLQNIQWQGIGSLKMANIYGVRNAPPDFVQFALAHGAVSMESDDAWNARLK